jgi:hypothetical protein
MGHFRGRPLRNRVAQAHRSEDVELELSRVFQVVPVPWDLGIIVFQHGPP